MAWVVVYFPSSRRVLQGLSLFYYTTKSPEHLGHLLALGHGVALAQAAPQRKAHGDWRTRMKLEKGLVWVSSCMSHAGYNILYV